LKSLYDNLKSLWMVFGWSRPSRRGALGLAQAAVAPSAVHLAMLLFTRHVAPGLCAGAAVALAFSRTSGIALEPMHSVPADGRLRALARSLAHLRPEEDEMRLRWDRDELGWRKLPARAWPVFQPGPDDIPKIAASLCGGRCTTNVEGLLPVVLPDGSMYTRKDTASASTAASCTQQAFDLATALVFNDIDAPRGVALYTNLAETGNFIDAHVALGA